MTFANYRGTILRTTLGDITRQDTDAIVNPANSDLIMGGGVAGAIKRTGGVEIEREAMQMAPVPIGRAVATGAGTLPARYVLHAPTMEKPAMRTNLKAIRMATRAALGLAHELHVGTLAFPGMGTGVGGVLPEDAAEAMIDEIKRFLDNKTEVKEVRFACLDQRLLRAFDQAISRLANR